MENIRQIKKNNNFKGKEVQIKIKNYKTKKKIIKEILVKAEAF